MDKKLRNEKIFTRKEKREIFFFKIVNKLQRYPQQLTSEKREKNVSLFKLVLEPLFKP